MIGYENTCIVDMLRKDLSNNLEEKHVDRLSQFIISQNEWLIDHIQGSYPYFGHQQVYTLAYLWSVVIGWSLDCPQMFNKTFLDIEVKTRLDKENANIIFALGRMKKLFLDWHKVAKNTFTFDFIDYLNIPFILDIFKRNLVPNKSLETLIEDRIHTVERLEEFAQSIFLIVVKDVMPAQLERFQEPIWLNVNAISLNPDAWDEEGLFEPKTTPRDITTVQNQILNVTGIRFSFRQKNGMSQAEKATFQFELDTTKHAKFFELAKSNDTISLVVLFSAFSVLIRKYIAQQDIVINTPHLANVEKDALQIPISLHVDTNRSFKEHLKMCQETLKEQYSKQKSDLLGKTR